MSPTIKEILLSSFMGLLGGLITIPISTFFSIRQKRDEIAYQHRLNLIEKEKELYLQHRLEIKRLEREKELNTKDTGSSKASEKVEELDKRISNLENQILILLRGSNK
jgi:hypothetical protein